MRTEMIRILLADDHQILRGGLQAVIDIKEDMRVVGHASDGVEAVRLFRELKPDVVIMDLVMPNKDGVEATRDILSVDPSARILVLTSFSESERISLAVRAGALGYVLKNTRPAELIQAIRQVARGQVSIQPAILQQLVRLSEKPPVQQQEELTPREHEVLKLIAGGLENAEIAEKLCISIRTVNTHITNIKTKLNLGNRSQITLYAISHGMLGMFPQNNHLPSGPAHG